MSQSDVLDDESKYQSEALGVSHKTEEQFNELQSISNQMEDELNDLADCEGYVEHHSLQANKEIV